MKDINHMSLQKESEWEKEFDRIFNPPKSVPKEIQTLGKEFLSDVKSFIKALLSNREKELAEEIKRRKR